MKPVNLHQVRKSKARADAKAKADANAVRFGRSKAQKVLEATQSSAAQTRLSQQKFEDE